MKERVQAHEESGSSFKDALESERYIQTFFKYINRFLGDAEATVESMRETSKIKHFSTKTDIYAILYRLLEYT